MIDTFCLMDNEYVDWFYSQTGRFPKWKPIAWKGNRRMWVSVY